MSVTVEVHTIRGDANVAVIWLNQNGRARDLVQMIPVGNQTDIVLKRDDTSQREIISWAVLLTVVPLLLGTSIMLGAYFVSRHYGWLP